MRIGLLTFHFSDNYGAALQAYALRRWFVEQGHEVHFIDYRPAHVEHGGRLSLPTSPARVKANLKVVYLGISAFVNRHFGNRDQMRKFIRFRQRFLCVSDNIARAENTDILTAAKKFDLIVAGSDQIWAPSQHYGFDRNYFLAFASEFSARKISYAASFGRDTVSYDEAKQLPALLANFDAISVREISGGGLVQQAIGRAPALVPDPTMLHTDYTDFIADSELFGLADYVFCYALRSPDNIRQTADQVASHFTIKVKSPHNPHRRWIEIGETVHPDPAEWVGLLKSARFVVTNSFHGTVFSLLFHKPFIVAGLTGSKASANARALNLLRAVGLEDRFTTAYTSSQVNALLARDINWDLVDRKLAELRQSGTQFLHDQIEAVQR